MDGFIINGQKVVIPGVTSENEANELAGKAAASKGYVAYLYEAERGGEPWVPVILTSPSAVRRQLPARLATIVSKLAFSPSTDTPRIPTGAQAVVLVRVNPAQQAALDLVDANDIAGVNVLAKDWGNYGSDIIATVEAGTTKGKKFTVALGATSEVFDNVGDMDAFSAAFVPNVLPAGVVITSVLGFVNPLAAAPAPVFYVNVLLALTGGTAAFDPRTWMAFDGNQAEADGKLEFTFDDQGAGPNAIVITGVRRDTGATVVDTIAVLDNAVTAKSTYSFSEITSIDVSQLTGSVGMSFSAFCLSPATYKTFAGIVDRVDSKGRGFEAAFITTKKTLEVANLDKDFGSGGTGNALTGGGHTFTADLYDFITGVTSAIVSVSRAATGVNVPKNQGPSTLTGGSDGVATTNAGGDWDKGLTAIKALNVSHVVPRTGDKAVHTLVSDHITYMCGAGRNERIGFVGCPAGTGKETATTGLYARASALNSRNMTLLAQEIQIYDENGEALWLEPFDTALLAAACDAGRPITDSITWALVDILAFRDQPNHVSPWNVVDDATELVNHNICLIETRPGTALMQWTRDVTTYQTDDNPIFCSVFANEGLNTSNKNIRQKLEIMIGRGPKYASAKNAKRVVLKELRRQKDAFEIKDYDPKSVTIDDLGNGFRADWRVAPPEAIYFIQATTHVARMPSNA